MLIPIITISFIVPWIWPNFAPSMLQAGMSDYLRRAIHAPLLIKCSAILISGISFFLLISIFWFLTRLLNCYIKNEFFSTETFHLFKKITSLLFYLTLYSPLEYTLLSFVTTLNNPPGHRMTAFSFSSNDVLHIIMVGCLAIITALMEQAYTIKHENDLTI